MAEPEIRLLDHWDSGSIAAFTDMSRKRSDGAGWEGRWLVDENYFRWKFQRYQWGEALCACAVVDGKLIGSATLRPVQAGLGDSAVSAGEIGDLYLDAPFRGRGIFGRLVSVLVDAALARGIEFAFCVPNSSGAAALMSTDRFAVVSQAAIYAFFLPLTPSAFLPKSAAGLARITIDPVIRGLTTMRRTPPEGGEWFAGDRIPPQLKLPRYPDSPTALSFGYPSFDWDHRIRDHPQNSLYTVHVKRRAADDIDAWCVVKEARLRGHPIRFVGAIVARSPREFRSLLRRVVVDSVGLGLTGVALWAQRRRVPAIVRPFTPFLPFDAKKVLLVRTPAAEKLIATSTPVALELIDTDKL